MYGAGGIGKTRVAIELASAIQARFPLGVWFADLSSLVPGDSVAAAIAGALGIGGPAMTADAVAESIGNRSILLVLDNCEHVSGSARDAIESILARSSNVRIVATSREPIGVAGERVYALAPLSATLGQELLALRARAVNPRFTVNARNAEAVARIVTLVDGLPLGIELAAARLDVLGAQALARALEASLEPLRDERRPTARHRTMHAVIDWGVDQLTFGERTFLRRLAVFGTASWTREAAAAVAGTLPISLDAVDRALTTLADRSLVIRADFAPLRYRLLQSMAAYSQERFAGSDDERYVRDRHARYFRELAEEKLSPAPTRTWTHRAPYLAELANFRTAMEWTLFGEGSREQGARLVAAAASLWAYAPNMAVIEPYLLRALEVAPTASVRGHLLHNLASYRDFSGRHEEAREAAAQALAIFRSEGDTLLTGRTLTRFASATHFCGESMCALGYAQEALRRAEEIDDLVGMAAAFANLSMIAASPDIGNESMLDDYLVRAEAALERLGDERQRVLLWGNAGAGFSRRGDRKRALAALRKAVALADRSEDLVCPTFVFINLADVHRRVGDIDNARATLRRALERAIAWSDEISMIQSIESAAAIAETTGKLDDAIALTAFVTAFRESSMLNHAESNQLNNATRERLRAAVDEARWTAQCARGEEMPFNDALALAALQ